MMVPPVGKSGPFICVISSSIEISLFSNSAINPAINSEIDCYIDNINKMGIISYIKMRDIDKNFN